VESWLRSLPLAKGSCAKIRNLMSLLFNHACRYELFDRNPIYLVRQSAKSRRTPTVLMPAEIKALVENLRIRERTLVLLAVSTGLRQSELFGLKWGDMDFAQRTMNVTRSIVYDVVGPCKTVSSQKPVPVHPLLVESLLDWRKKCIATKPDDWVFASRRSRGRGPYWGQAILRKYFNQHMRVFASNPTLSRSRARQITLTTQAVIGKTRDDGCSEADSHPKCAAYHRSHHVAPSVTMTLIWPLTSSPGEQRDFLHLNLESRPFITSNSKAIRYPRRYVAHAGCRVDGLFLK